MKKTVNDPLLGSIEFPYFDGFPYLVTQVVTNLNHYLLMPHDANPLELRALAVRQVRANRMRSCLVLAHDRATYIEPDLSIHESQSPPLGGHPFAAKLRPHWSVGVTADLLERELELAAYIERHTTTGYILGDLGMGGREASGEELRRLAGYRSDGVPNGLARCNSCGEYCGECLHQNPEYQSCVITVRCACENWNHCAACGGKLADRRLNAPYWDAGSGTVRYVPGFTCTNHTCRGQRTYRRLVKPAPATRAEKRMYEFLQENPGYYCAPYPGGRQYVMLKRMQEAGLVASTPVPFYGENWYAIVDGIPAPAELANEHWRVPKPWPDWMEQEGIPLPPARGHS